MKFFLTYNKPIGLNTLNEVPFTHACLDPQAVWNTDTFVFGKAQVEPSIAVNPRNGKRIVVGWQNARISNGGCLNYGIAYSKNKGQTWKFTSIPIQLCTNHGCMVGAQRVSDIWLSWSEDGERVFLNGLAFFATPVEKILLPSIIVTSSKNGGKTWEPIITLTTTDYTLSVGDGPVDDKNAITADQFDPKFVYIVWDRFPYAASFHSDCWFSRSLDQGKSWTCSCLIYDPYPDLLYHNLSNGIYNDCQVINTQIITFPKSQLCFMNRIYATPSATDEQFTNDTFPYPYTLTDIVFIKSKDHGATWSKNAKLVIPLDSSNLVFTGGYNYNPDGSIASGRGFYVRAGEITWQVVTNKKTGDIYLAYQTGTLRSDKLPQIALIKSSDQGRTWTKPIRVNQTPEDAPNPQAFTASLYVTDEGYIGILYADFRYDDFNVRVPGPYPPDHITKTDNWFVIYKDHKDCFKFVEELRLTPQSYGMEFGPLARGFMSFGDYMMVRSYKNNFYLAHTAILKNNLPIPPMGSELFFSDPEHDANLYLDQYLRSIVHVAKISSHKPNCTDEFHQLPQDPPLPSNQASMPINNAKSERFRN
jgi:hypothetical protein